MDGGKNTSPACSGTNSPSTSGLRQIRWYGKASLCTNSPSTAGLSLNRMVRKWFVWHKLSIHFRLVFKSDGGFKQDRPKRLHPFWDLIKSDGGFKQDRPKRLHPYWNLIKSDGGFIQECLKKLHPFFALIKSDGGCHSHANRKSQKKCNWQG